MMSDEEVILATTLDGDRKCCDDFIFDCFSWIMVGISNQWPAGHFRKSSAIIKITNGLEVVVSGCSVAVIFAFMKVYIS